MSKEVGGRQTGRDAAGNGGRGAVAAGGRGPLAAASGLPLFPVEAPGAVQRRRDGGAPLGVRRATPAVPRLRVPSSGRQRPRQLPLDPGAQASSSPPRTPAATVPARLGAAFYDVALLLSLDVVVVVLTLRLAGLGWGGVDQLPAVPLLAFLLLLDTGYLTVLTAVGGQTFGKMALGIAVTTEDGAAVPFPAALARTLGYLVSLLPLGLGFVWAAVDGGRRALHDRLAGTRVVAARPGPSRRALRGARG